MIKKYVKENQNNSIVYQSLGRFNYLSVMKNVDCVVGNSSSGVIEAPFLKIPSAHLTNLELIKECAATNIPILISTGMSDWGMIDDAVELLEIANTNCVDKVLDVLSKLLQLKVYMSWLPSRQYFVFPGKHIFLKSCRNKRPPGRLSTYTKS